MVKLAGFVKIKRHVGSSQVLDLVFLHLLIFQTKHSVAQYALLDDSIDLEPIVFGLLSIYLCLNLLALFGVLCWHMAIMQCLHKNWVFVGVVEVFSVSYQFVVK